MVPGKMKGERLIHPITNSPAITPIIADVLFTLLENNPRRNIPSIPPLKTDASFHHVSSALWTFIIARATIMAIILKRKEEMYNTFMDPGSLFSSFRFLTK